MKKFFKSCSIATYGKIEELSEESCHKLKIEHSFTKSFGDNLPYKIVRLRSDLSLVI